MQQRATRWNRTCGRCNEDTASVRGASALRPKPPRFPDEKVSDGLGQKCCENQDALKSDL